MKRAFCILLCAAFLCFSVAGCGNERSNPAAAVVASSPKEVPLGVVPHNPQIKLDLTKDDIIQLDGLALSDEAVTNQYVKEGIVEIAHVGFDKTEYFFLEDNLEMLNYTKENANDTAGDFDKLKTYFQKSYGMGEAQDTNTRNRFTWENNVLDSGMGYSVVLSCYPERNSVTIAILIL